jgi:tellurite resistance protein
MALGTSKLSGRQPGERQKLESSVKLLLIWVAASDGNLDLTELAVVDEQLPDTERTVKAEDLMHSIRTQDLKQIESAVRTLAKEGRDVRLSFLDMAVRMAVADRGVDVPENLILRFYADALFLGLGVLQKRFHAVTGRDLPEPGDPGSPGWWSGGSGNKRGGTAGGGAPL